ncbi:MAG: hypothetical protein J7M18_03290 [Candidatus Eremiobacteraeota bacterium]|nr:hypothetical protein [Candidatus Eremiobacteraeota bacterium]
MPEHIDWLTYLRTEEFLYEHLPYEIARSERYKRPLTFLLVEPELEPRRSTDLLYPVLKKIANFIRTNTRFVDISVRIGMQIFMIMTETNIEGAKVVEKKIKKLVESEQYEVSPAFPNASVNLRTALGSYPEIGKEPTTILRNLREKLYAPASSPPKAGKDNQKSQETEDKS